MPSANVRAFEMDRRQLLAMAGTYGIGATFIQPSALAAAQPDECKELDIGPDQGGIKTASRLYYWIDGMFTHVNNSLFNTNVAGLEAGKLLPARANLTVFMELNQTNASYVDAVILLDKKRHTMGVRYLDKTMKMQSGFVPFVTFENIALKHEDTYFVIFRRVGTSKTELFEATVKNPSISLLTEAFMPGSLRRDVQQFVANGKSNNSPVPGIITNPFLYYTQAGLGAHCARGRILDIGSDGSFSIDVDFMHGDSSNTHYMRNFIIMDPVGRILGMVRRPNFVSGANGKVNITRLTSAERASIADGGYEIPEVGGEADIRDCPYIQVYTEDAFDAMARSIIRLR